MVMPIGMPVVGAGGGIGKPVSSISWQPNHSSEHNRLAMTNRKVINEIAFLGSNGETACGVV